MKTTPITVKKCSFCGFKRDPEQIRCYSNARKPRLFVCTKDRCVTRYYKRLGWFDYEIKPGKKKRKPKQSKSNSV